MWDIFSSLDKDNSGFLEVEELRAYHQQQTSLSSSNSDSEKAQTDAEPNPRPQTAVVHRAKLPHPRASRRRLLRDLCHCDLWIRLNTSTVTSHVHPFNLLHPWTCFKTAIQEATSDSPTLSCCVVMSVHVDISDSPAPS